MRSIVYLVLLIFIISEAKGSTGFIDGVYPDLMGDNSPFRGRNSSFTFADPVNVPDNVYNLYSTAAHSDMVIQQLAKGLDGMPSNPNITLLANSGINKPTDANLYTSIGISMPNNNAYIISSIDTGIAIYFCGPSADPNTTPMILHDWDYIYWNDTVLNTYGTFPNDTINNQIVSLARSTSATGSEVIIGVLYNTEKFIFRALLMHVDFGVGYTGMANVLFPAPNMVIARPALVAYPERGVNTYIFAYAYQTGAVSWSLLIQTINDTLQLTNITEYALPATNRPVDIDMAYIGSDTAAITYQIINATHASVRQLIINAYGQQILSDDELAEVADTSVTYVFAANVIPDGKLITLWSKSSDTTIFNGRMVDFNGNTNLPTIDFVVPAADPTQAIARLIVAPFSSDSFAVTQAYVNANYASFTNYYTMSFCADESGNKTLTDCITSHYGCRCLCNTNKGWHDAGDGTCKTVCGDNIVAGNETCDNTADPNCISCTCAQDLVWSTTQLLCVSPSAVTPSADNPTPSGAPSGAATGAPSAVPSGGSGWSYDYIAAIVLCPVAAGAAIFLGVYFGKKRKSGQKKSKDKSDGDQQPQELLSDKEPGSTTIGDSAYGQIGIPAGSYGAIPKVEEIEMQSEVGAKNSSNKSQADKLNVPYAELKFITEIGAGAYGKVFIGEWQRVKVALKINTSATGADFEREAKLMVELRPHPNVVQMLGVSSDGPYPVMILEYCDGGSLDSKLFDMSKVWTVADQLRTVTGIAKGLYHLHKNQIIHRDISARNILMNFNQPKISDFGMSRFVADTKKGSTTKSNIGPIRWMAPESLKNQSYSTKSDVWTFGLVIYEIVARKEPHEEADQIAIGVQIRDRGATPEIPEGCDPCLKEIMQKCWQMDPEKRPTMEDICDILDNYLEANKL